LEYLNFLYDMAPTRVMAAMWSVLLLMIMIGGVRVANCSIVSPLCVAPPNISYLSAIASSFLFVVIITCRLTHPLSLLLLAIATPPEPFIFSSRTFSIFSKHIQIKISLVIRESRQGLPFTLSPEYVAAQRAYMRYHNMNPIFGISSK
jgi:hypothetical protein